jgi:polyhydroxybutyrate depolymerase
MSGPTIPSTLGGARPAALFVPAAYDPARRWPLVVLLHGYGAEGASQARSLGLVAEVDASGFVLLAPDGTPDHRGARFWNASPSCCDFDGLGIDDVGYVRGLIAEARASLAIDPDRVTLVGVSNGGFLAHRLACEAADLVSAVASIGGSMAEGVPCTPSRAVSVLLVHGTADALIRYDGGAYGGGAPYQGLEALARAWAARDGCKAEPLVASTPQDLDRVVAGPETIATTWTSCSAGARVDLWTMQGSPHIPAFTARFTDALLRTCLER